SLVAAGAFATCFAVVVIGRPGDRPASSADALTATVVATLPTLEVRRAAISRTPADNQLPAAILPRQPTPRVADGTDVGASRDGRIAILAVPLPPARPRNIGAEARPMVQRASLSQFPPPRPEP
ncbi:MAG: hypothetical protein ACJ8CQ_14265, partial [Microvirga sp.]